MAPCLSRKQGAVQAGSCVAMNQESADMHPCTGSRSRILDAGATLESKLGTGSELTLKRVSPPSNCHSECRGTALLDDHLLVSGKRYAIVYDAGNGF